MRSEITTLVSLLILACLPAQACDLVPPSRLPTLAEELGGVGEIFGGTVVGYRTYGGVELMGPPPSECRDENGYFVGRWPVEELPPSCQLHLDVVEALFRVDVPIVGPLAVGDIAHYKMHWGDGDCDQDFVVGQKWLIAGPVIEELQAPIRDDEIAKLRHLAAGPAFDMKQLYAPHPNLAGPSP